MERKVATVVFVDLVGSTALVAGADPEVVRQRVNRYFEQVSGTIEKHGGTVEKFAGDAVMAAFGVPVTHEDDAERALRAALEIVPQVEALGLGVRIGVESGEVVVEDAESTFATGEAVNLAVRLQQAARAGPGPARARVRDGSPRVPSRSRAQARSRSRAAHEPLWTWRALHVARSGASRPPPRSSAARPSWSCSRTRSSGRCGIAPRSSSRSSASSASARRGSSRSSPIRSSV